MTMIRKTKPEKGNKYFNTVGNGGYSTCVKGSPTQSGLDVLCNCVGYANGAFNETVGKGKEVYPLNCNAENFIERAIKYGLTISQEPTLGGIMVWQKGATLSGSDGAGHVAYVSELVDKDTILTSESGWKSSAFWTSKRKRGTGNWGQSSAYKYRGCIVNPAIKETPSVVPEQTNNEEPNVPNNFKVGDKVVPTKLVDYNGTKVVQYDEYYTISELVGNRAVLKARGQVWCAINTDNIKLY